jgi:hypothetical protein
MLTDRQRRRCGEIAGALDAGNLSIWLKTEPSLSVAEKAEIWSQRARVKAQAERRRQREAVPSKRLAPPTPKDEPLDDLGPDDADDWPLDDDDDSPPRQEWTTCRACRGLGRLGDGSRCSVCNGSEEESFRYEFSEEE